MKIFQNGRNATVYGYICINNYRYMIKSEMKKFFYGGQVGIILFLAILVSSCNRSGMDGKFHINEKTVEALGEGGLYKVTYSLEKRQDKFGLECLSSESWVNGFNTEVEGEITFSVDMNKDGSAREAEVSVKCGAETASFIVIQSEFSELSISLQEKTKTTVTCAVKTFDEEMTYFITVVEQSYYDSFASDEELFQADIAYFNQMAEMFQCQLEDVLKLTLLKGSVVGKKMTGLNPAEKYCVYAYGLTTGGKRLTDVFKISVETEGIELIDASFTISCNVDNADATISIVPKPDDVTYVWKVYLYEPSFDAETFKNDFQKQLSDSFNRYLIEGNPAEGFLDEVASQGPVENLVSLTAETEYLVFAVAIDDEALLVSDMSFEKFATGTVPPSDNEITLTISNIDARVADYEIQTTNNDPYVVFIDKAVNWRDVPEDETLKTLCKNYKFINSVRRGDAKGQMVDLHPATEYVVYVFGYQSGVATTGLWKQTFETIEAEVSDVTFELSYDKWFNGDDVAKKYGDKGYANAAGYAVVPVGITTTGNVSKYYYHIFPRDFTDADLYSDDVVIDELLLSGLTSPTPVFYLPWNTVCTVLGVAEDEDGLFGVVFRLAIKVTKDGASPVTEFVLPQNTGVWLPAAKGLSPLMPSTMKELK